MRIDVDKYAVRFIGMMTLELIEKELKDYYEQGIENVEVDMKGKGIHKDDTRFLAKMKYKYNCNYKGIGNKKYEIDVYLKTGYFIKNSMGGPKYVEWFRRQVERADFPLMLQDNRLRGYQIVPINVIQPLKFEGRYFHYNVIKPQYLEPEEMELALETGVNIYTKKSVRIEDMANEHLGFRFAGTYRERCILDIYEDIITGKVRGYREIEVG